MIKKLVNWLSERRFGIYLLALCMMFILPVLMGWAAQSDASGGVIWSLLGLFALANLFVVLGG